MSLKNKSSLKILNMKTLNVLLNILLINISCRAQVSSDITKIVDTFHADINGDGIKDKIIVYKNLEKPLGFEQEHFKLPVKMFFGENKNKYKLWYENNLLIFDNVPTCVSEGYSNILVKRNFFTIESQTCSDYNILITSYLTFKTIKNKIFLYKV